MLSGTQPKGDNMTTKQGQDEAGAGLKAVKVLPTPEADINVKVDVQARFALRPSVHAATVVRDYGKAFGDLDLGALIDSLVSDIRTVNAGNLSRVEGMLYAQAQALQAMFSNMARRATSQEYLKQWEAYMRMAMKAQAQCRMTLETLAAIKNPPVVFARQANINQGGQQQVNNGPAPDAANSALPGRARAANPNPNQTELLEASDGQRLDTGATRTASSADPHLAPVGEVHRPAHR